MPKLSSPLYQIDIKPLIVPFCLSSEISVQYTNFSLTELKVVANYEYAKG